MSNWDRHGNITSCLCCIVLQLMSCSWCCAVGSTGPAHSPSRCFFKAAVAVSRHCIKWNWIVLLQFFRLFWLNWPTAQKSVTHLLTHIKQSYCLHTHLCCPYTCFTTKDFHLLLCWCTSHLSILYFCQPQLQIAHFPEYSPALHLCFQSNSCSSKFPFHAHLCMMLCWTEIWWLSRLLESISSCLTLVIADMIMQDKPSPSTMSEILTAVRLTSWTMPRSSFLLWCSVWAPAGRPV